MKKSSKIKFAPVTWMMIGILLLAVLFAISAGPSFAQVGAVDLFWHTLAGGGTASGSNAAGAYTLNSAIGQTVSVTSSGGQGSTAYELTGGYLASPTGLWWVYLPVMRR